MVVDLDIALTLAMDVVKVVSSNMVTDMTVDGDASGAMVVGAVVDGVMDAVGAMDVKTPCCSYT